MQEASVHRVLNATGAILHPDVGRAPLSIRAREALLDAAGYAGPVDPAPLVAAAAGAEAAHVVTSTSAALLLVLTALAADGEVVVPRSDQPRLHDGARVDELLDAAGANQRDVGTSTSVDLPELRRAIGERTRLVLTVASPPAPSGTRPPLSEVAALTAELGCPLVHLLGNGPLRPTSATVPLGTSAAEAIAAGVDLAIVAADGFVGGPAAGLLVGRARLVEACTSSVLAPVLALDPLRRAALHATLASHHASDPPLDLPVLAMSHADPAQLEARARWIASQLDGHAEAVATRSPVDGQLGAPARGSWGVRLPASDPDELAATLARGVPPVVARRVVDAVLVDLRTVPPVLDADLAAALADAVDVAPD